MAGGEQYFEASPSSRTRTRTIRVDLGDRVAHLVTDRGTFSTTRVDPGSQFLVDSAPPPAASGDLLDLGCGYGPLAVAMASRSPGASVWAIDVNERALALTASNAAGAALGNVRAVAPDGVPDDVRFSTIWSNPPIRVGKERLHDLLRRWLTRLAPDGTAVIVVAKNLGADSLARWLDDEIGPTRRLASKRGYRLLEVRSRGGAASDAGRIDGEP